MISQRQLFLKYVAQTSDAPMGLEIEKAEGVYLYDINGKAYLDLISGIAVSNLGHRHPKIIEAIKQQTDRFLHTLVYGEFVLSPQVELAELLSEQLPDNLNATYFVNSGSEATEGAMKLAKRFTGRTEFVACNKAYHGSSQGAMSLMSDAYFTAPFRPLLPAIKFIEYNEEKDLQQINENTAAVIIETIRGEIGVMEPKNNYLKKVRERCNQVGALLILDEIQVGCGRTGSLFAFEQYGIVPDVLLLAKAFGGGMPLGAFIASKEIMHCLTENPYLGHITTFGGHPVCCAAGLASLKILVEEKQIIEAVEQKANLFKARLKHKAIKEIRNVGLLMAVEVASFEVLSNVIASCLEQGLITDWFLFNNTALRIAPPLTITEAEIEKACTILLNAFDQL